MGGEGYESRGSLDKDEGVICAQHWYTPKDLRMLHEGLFEQMKNVPWRTRKNVCREGNISTHIIPFG